MGQQSAETLHKKVHYAYLQETGNKVDKLLPARPELQEYIEWLEGKWEEASNEKKS